MTETPIMTDPYDVFWHVEQGEEGLNWIVGRVPLCQNQVTQGHTFGELTQAVKELVAVTTDIAPESVAVGPFTEESEADFIEAIS